LRVPQVAFGVDDRTVGRCARGVDAREAAHVGYRGAIGVVIAAENHRLAGIAEVHRAAVEAEADRIGNGRSRQRETAQAEGEGKLVEAARRTAALVLGAEHEIAVAIAAAVVEAGVGASALDIGDVLQREGIGVGIEQGQALGQAQQQPAVVAKCETAQPIGQLPVSRDAAARHVHP
jgi:hypothetical protein